MIRDYTAATALLLAALGLQVVEPVMADLPPGFTDQSVAEFTSPKDFVFLRDFSESELDDTMLVLLQHGTVMRIRGATSTTPEVDTYMEIGSNNVMGYQEDGAISIIVDPAFSTNGHFYVYYTRPEHPDDLRPGELGGNGRRQRISRFTYDDTCSIDTCVSATVLGSTPSQNVQECVCGTEEIIWEADEQASHGLGRHSAGGMGIGPDGMLYLAIGDNGNTQIQAKNPCNTYGSVIRVSPDPADLGTPPAGNPIWVFSDLSSHPDLPNSCDPAAGVGDAGYCLGCLPGGDSTQNFVYAIGLRNPFRASWEGSRFIIGEVGEGNFEDIHAMNQPGLNFRWPYCAGPCEGSGCDAVDCYADGEEPIHSYAHEVTNSYPMGIGGFGESLTGGFIYHVDDPPLDHQFPADPYDGVYFFANWGDYPFLNYLEFDQNGDVTVDQEGNTIMHDFANGDQTLPNAIGQVIALAQGPDGAIYYIDRGGDGDGVRRIAYNLSPTIESVSVDPRSSAEAPLTVSLDALATDPESDPVYYRWLITPPVGSIIVAENVGDETDPALTQALNAPGVYSIRVEARDDLNLSTAAVNASDPILVEVGRRPIPTMLSPEPCSLFQAGDTIQLSGEAFDPNDPEGSEDLAYDWSVVLLRDQGAGGSIPIPIGETQVNDSGTTVASFDIDSLGDLDFEVFKGLEFRLTVSDNPEGAGLSETVATRIYAKRASFPVDSDPCGFMVQFGPDHVRLSTPAEYSAMVGQEFTFGFDDSDVDLACVLNERYEFSEWSDDPLL
jgi:glucose/arabinose dehydrogenase